MSTTPTVSEALESLRSALEAEARQTLQDRVARALEGLSLNGNGHAPKAEQTRNVSSAGRARQIAGSKAYWARVRLATKARAK